MSQHDADSLCGNSFTSLVYGTLSVANYLLNALEAVLEIDANQLTEG